jgi:hypothetical protein
MADQEALDPTDLYRKVLAGVKEAGITDPVQAEELADAISVDLLDEFRPRTDGDEAVEEPSSEAAVEELRVVAEELREERGRLEWTAAQVAHLVHPGKGPSIDPDPTPPGAPPPPVAEDGAEPAPAATQLETTEMPSLSAITEAAEDPDPQPADASGDGIPEHLPIRRLHRPWHRRALPVLLSVLVLLLVAIAIVRISGG